MSHFGYLEIFWPDNPAESYILPKAIIALGRSSGNDLVIDRDGVSRYHAKLKVEEQQAWLSDLESVNGIYVDGERVKPDSPYSLKGGEEIQLADVRLVYYPPALLQDTIPTLLDDTVEHIITEQFKAQLIGPESEVIPGAHVQATLNLENLAPDLRRYQVQVEGLPKEWVRIQRSDVELSEGEQTSIPINFKPLRRSETEPKHYPFSLRVTPKDQPDLAMSLTSSLLVGSFGGFGVALGTPLIEGQQAFDLHVHNQGNNRLMLNLRGSDKQQALLVTLAAPTITLGPGERRTIQGNVALKKPSLFGSPRQYRYDIISQAQDPSGFQAPVSGLYRAKPALPAWAATLAIPIAAVLVIGLVMLVVTLFGGEEVPAPVIQNFDAQQTNPRGFVVGETIPLTWQVSNAQTLTLRYGRLGQAEASITLEADGLGNQGVEFDSSGSYRLILEAVNTEGQIIRAERQIMINPRVELSAESAQLWRDVNQTLRLTWVIEGVDPQASALLRSNSAGLILEQTVNLSESGLLLEQLRPTGPEGSLNLSLEVNGFDGSLGQGSVVIQLVEPTCQILEDITAFVYEGPGQTYRRLGSQYLAGETLRPFARDASNQWVLVEREGQRGWVFGKEIACQGFTLASLLAANAADIPPSPTPSPTRTPSPTSSATPTWTPSATSTPTASATPTLPTFTATPRPTTRP
jgi:hypothetical protein